VKLAIGRPNVIWLRFTDLRSRATDTFSLAGAKLIRKHQLPQLESTEVAEQFDAKIPVAYLAVPTGILPTLAAIQWRRRKRTQRRAAAGLCSICGYDLRASTGRCPECGNAESPNQPHSVGRISVRWLAGTFVLAALVLAGSVGFALRQLNAAQQRLNEKLRLAESLAEDLRKAADASDLVTLNRLLDLGADPSEDGLLHDAVQKGDAATIRLLLDRGAAVDGIIDKGMSDGVYTPLAEAVISGHTELIPLLLERGADWRHIHFPILAAFVLWDPTFSVAQHEADANARDDDGNTLLHLAAARGDAAAVKDLLSCGADPNAANEMSQSPLDLLLGNPAEFYRTFTPPPFAGADRGQCLELLLEHGSTINSGAEPLIFRALWNRDMIIRLIKQGYDVNVKTVNGFTPLHAAPGNPSADSALVVAALLDAGAEVNARTSTSGETPLHAAAENPQVIRVLIEHGADVHARDNEGKTPLHYAASRASASGDAVRLLLRSGADPNARDSSGRTPLHAAMPSMGGVDQPRLYADPLQALLDGGADINAFDSSGDTARDLALRAGAKAIAEWLFERGGTDRSARPKPQAP
jgi:cytohesin